MIHDAIRIIPLNDLRYDFDFQNNSYVFTTTTTVAMTSATTATFYIITHKGWNVWRESEKSYWMTLYLKKCYCANFVPIAGKRILPIHLSTNSFIFSIYTTQKLKC